MTALIIAFCKKHIAAFALIGSILVIGLFIYFKGWSDRGAKDKSASQAHTINRSIKRGQTNEKVRNMDDVIICGAIGGVYRNDKCQ